MPYTTGTQGADANCAKTFMEGALHTALTAVLTYVEERTSSTNTFRIYKSVAANNFFGSDWYVSIYRTSDAATSLTFTVFELYDSGTHLAKNYIPVTHSQIPTGTYAVNDATGKAPTDTSTIFYLNGSSLGLSASGFNYYISALADRVVVATRVGATSYGFYAGLYDDALAISASPFPLVGLFLIPQSLSGNINYGGSPREPNQTIANAANWAVHPYNSVPSWTAAFSVENYTGKAMIGRAPLFSARTGNPGFRGLLRDVWYSPVGGANGDTLTATINGVSKNLVQVQVSGGSYYFVDTGL